MQLHWLPCLLLSLALSVPSARGVTIDLDGIAPRVRSSHPHLKAARLAIDEARGRLLGSGRRANPTLSVEFQGESGLSPGASGIGIDQAFPLTNRLALEKHLSAQAVEAAELEVRDAERRLIAEAQALAVRLLAVKALRSLRQNQAGLAKELADFARDRSAKGELSPLEAAQALVDAQRAAVAGKTLEAEAVATTGQLKQALGVPADEELTLSGTLPERLLPAETDWKARPDLQAARLRTDAARTETDLARARKWDDLSAGLFAAREHEDRPGGGTDRSGYVGLRFSLPLPFWNRNEGEIAEKTARAERTQLETEALAADIAVEADAAREEMAAHADLAAEIESTLLPAVRQQLERLEAAYQRGETDLLSLLRAREQRLELESAALDATRDFHLARIRYEAAIGVHAPAAKASSHSSSPVR
ncbi:MAG: TolC family protein [Verrucomicrobiales bacterium]|nr:TolC family protein [Verrucomicrobiales bacterium]